MGFSTVRRIAALVLLLVAGLVPAATAEPRIALVVGNSAYEQVGALENPRNDARLTADTLSGLGFEVTLLVDAPLAEFRTAIGQFGRDLRAAGPEATGLFYYAGHGVQSFQTNYLVPVDALLTDAADISLVGIEADTVLRQMASARNRTNIFILDACRNNPFVRIPEFGDNGLAEMRAPTGTFVALATEPNRVALDGAGANSPFTAALAREMPVPGQPIEQMFKRVRVAVLEATGGLQTPWDASSLTTDFFFAAPTPQSAEDQLWDSVRGTRDPVQIMLYMRAYPDGAHFEEARLLLAEVIEVDLAGAAPSAPPAPPAAEGPAAAPPAAQPSAAQPPAGQAPADQPGPAVVAGAAPDAVPGAAAAPPPGGDGPASGERADFDAAQAAGTVESWEEFLAQHPGSVFRELAEIELAAAREQSGLDPDANPPGQGLDGWERLTLDIFFDRPLAEGGGNVAGKAISELIAGQPLFPPFEGVPDEMWKGHTCANCHNWTQPALCDQGKFYEANDIDDGLGEIHPYGGQFRRVLRAWAAQGCR